MARKQKDQPTQQTAKGATIPVPTRKDVLGDLAKVAKPRRSIGKKRSTDK
jgi:hypothetical protein